MIAYNYNTETGFYNGEVECQKDPLESIVEQKDVWLTPGDCTLVKPPEYDIQNSIVSGMVALGIWKISQNQLRQNYKNQLRQ